MELIQLILAAIILGFIYKKMFRWGEADSISKKQAYISLGLGVLATIITFILAIVIAMSIVDLGYNLADIENQFVKASALAFFRAGFPEELSKLLMIVLAVKLFKPDNIYKYILIGAGVGMGFTLNEELVYGGTLIGFCRFFTVAFHMLLGIFMAEYIGRGLFHKANGEPYKLLYLTAFLVPVVIHTFYDALTAYNPAVEIGDIDDEVVGMWLLAAIVFEICIIIWQVVYIKRLKKIAAKYVNFKFNSISA